jgi:hypothetical protein
VQVGKFRVIKNAELTVDFNTSRERGGKDVDIRCRIHPFEVFYSRRLLSRLLPLINQVRTCDSFLSWGASPGSYSHRFC